MGLVAETVGTPGPAPVHPVRRMALTMFAIFGLILMILAACSGFVRDANSKVITDAGVHTVAATALAQLSATPATALSQWTGTWGPMLNEFGDVLLRVSGVAVKTDFEIAALVKAMTLTATPLSLQQLVTGLGFENVVVGTSGLDILNATNPIGTNVFVGGGGTDFMTGGAKQDIYVVGDSFGNDYITETGGYGSQSGDRLRFATSAVNDNGETQRKPRLAA
jgi:hypothetical protein